MDFQTMVKSINDAENITDFEEAYVQVQRSLSLQWISINEESINNDAVLKKALLLTIRISLAL